MLIRNCAGGVVFHENTVFLLKNDKGEWVLPKGVIRGGILAQELAKARVLSEGGVTAEIVVSAGDTNYEFFSATRRQPVCNRIHWFIMEAVSPDFTVDTQQGFQDGGFFAMPEALERITYTQDQALVRLSYEKYLKIKG